MKPISIPPKHCSTKKAECHFFGHTLNYQEDYCHLYNQYTKTDEQYPAKQKPDFCTAALVKITGVEVVKGSADVKA